MRFSFNSFNESAYFGLATDPRRVIAAAAGAGFDLVGLDFPTIAAFAARGGTIDQIAQGLRDEGIGCNAITAAGMYGDGNSVADVTRQAAEWATALGAPFVQGNCLTRDFDQQLRDLEEACDAARAVDPGVIVVLEHLPGFGLDTLNGAIALAGRVGYDRARVLVDIWHVSHSADTWDDVAAMPAEALAYVEVCDALPPVGTDLGLEMTQRRTFPGEGALDNQRFHQIFADRGYDGIISVEVVNQEWRGGDLDTFARRCLAAARRLWPESAVA